LFRKTKEGETETIDNFIVRLSKLVISCELAGDQKNDMIQDQIVNACKSTELRRKFLAAQNLTLEKVLGLHMLAKCPVLPHFLHTISLEILQCLS
jgi:hypothetical protein